VREIAVFSRPLVPTVDVDVDIDADVIDGMMIPS
jgi:hypothetical protein